jgi:hypothetical protein
LVDNRRRSCVPVFRCTTASRRARRLHRRRSEARLRCQAQLPAPARTCPLNSGPPHQAIEPRANTASSGWSPAWRRPPEQGRASLPPASSHRRQIAQPHRWALRERHPRLAGHRSRRLSRVQRRPPPAHRTRGRHLRAKGGLRVKDGHKVAKDAHAAAAAARTSRPEHTHG